MFWSRLFHFPSYSAFGVIFFEKSQLLLFCNWLEMGRYNPNYHRFVAFLWTVNDQQGSCGIINNDEGYPRDAFSNRGRTNPFVFINRFIGWCDDHFCIMIIRLIKRPLKSTDYDMIMKSFMLVRWCLIIFQVCMNARSMNDIIEIEKKN